MAEVCTVLKVSLWSRTTWITLKAATAQNLSMLTSLLTVFRLINYKKFRESKTSRQIKEIKMMCWNMRILSAALTGMEGSCIISCMAIAWSSELRIAPFLRSKKENSNKAWFMGMDEILMWIHLMVMSISGTSKTVSHLKEGSKSLIWMRYSHNLRVLLI